MFHNEFIGDFWYMLNFEAKDSPPLELPFMECPIGKNTVNIYIYIYIYNNLNNIINIYVLFFI